MPRPPKRIDILTPDQLGLWKPPIHQWIIPNLLEVEGSMMIYGEEHTFKSMISQDLMYKIGAGKPWLGFPTFKSSVWYYQTEISKTMMRNRTIKYRKFHDLYDGHPDTQRCYISSERYIKIDKGYGCTLFEDGLDRIHPDVAIIDPMLMSFASDLCSNYEMGLALNKVDQWRQDRKMAVVIIHHANQAEHFQGQKFHYGTDSSFGASIIKDWFDTMVYVERIGEDSDTGYADLRLHVEKHRNAETDINNIDIVFDRNTLSVELKGLL